MNKNTNKFNTKSRLLIESEKDSDEEIERLCIESVAEHAGVVIEKITKQKKLKEDLGYDSLDIVELILDIETVFNLQMNEKKLAAKDLTVEELINIVKTLTIEKY
jgi:acyl carrier protein